MPPAREDTWKNQDFVILLSGTGAPAPSIGRGMKKFCGNVFDFGPHEQCRRKSHPRPQAQLLAERTCVVEQNEVCFTVFGIGEVPGT